MAEQKSDFVNSSNREVIDREMEGLVKRIDSIYNNETGSRELAKVSKNPYTNRDSIVLKVPLSKINSALGNFGNSDEWTYGPYYLEGGVKTGFRKMVNGQWLFIEADNQLDKSLITVYDNPMDLAEAIKIENPSLGDSSVKVIDNKIEIIGAINDINLPSTDLVYDQDTGCIRSTLDPNNRLFEIKCVNAYSADMTTTDSSLGYQPGSGTETTGKKSTLSSNLEKQEELDNSEIASENKLIINIDDLSPKGMCDTFRSYSFNGEDSVNKEMDGATKSLNLREDNSSNKYQNEKYVLLNNIWITACCGVDNQQNTGADEMKNSEAFEGDNAIILNSIMKSIRIDGIFDVNNILENLIECEINDIGHSVEIAINFLNGLEEVSSFNLDFSNQKTVQEYIELENGLTIPPPQYKPQN